ncbi:TonB-dependent receptor plug domain-containing protein [Allochromatium vinosum]|uniref:TonB-dependent receptor plug domain-containing protein n=1 Tax=Allochromatium vinosum TaxID=1049 RepID=UPI001907D238|nr:TonB-dependent receptor [Allochromatium vinosum]MBK1653941.1 TonB-dependent receptor [Allochromatium vinosum]
MPNERHRLALTLTLLGLALNVQAESTPPVYDLGTVTVTATPEAPLGTMGADQVASVVTLDAMRRYNRDTVGAALDLLPGVTVATNSRNEQVVFVRGFDARQVPLFIDGIPVYVPYDGYVDFGRFTTADLSAIQVAKGFSSVTYGPNTLGGAINLISRKPTRELEGDVSLGFGEGTTRQASANVGSNQGLWYVQAGAAWIDSDGFRLSSDFEPTATEDGGARENAYHRDDKLSFKLGLTPNATDEYALSYYRQHGEKGQPPSTDPSAARYWQWPYWDKESLYFISRTALGATESVKLRLYHDSYDNAVESYTDDTYTRLKTSGRGSLGAAGKSVYDDRTLGGAIELRSTRFARHDLGLSVQLKQDEHQADDTLKQTEHFEDTQTTVGLEDNIRLREDLTLALGATWSELRPETVDKLTDPVPKPDAQSAANGQAGLFWDVAQVGRLYATVATKTRFPTLKDRYSLRLGTAIPNPDLEAEHSINYEIGYQGTPWGRLSLEAALFLSDVTDLIQQVNDVEDDKYQMQNVGEVRLAGLELSAKAPIGAHWELGGNLTLLDRENRSDPDTRLTGVPDHKLTAHVLFRPIDRLEALLYLQYEGSRWDSQTVELDSYTTANFKLSYRPVEALLLEARLDNLADADYALADGYPAAGRTWMLNARYAF